MNIANILNRKLGLVTVQNLQRVFNFFSTSLGLVDGAIPDSRPYKVYTAKFVCSTQVVTVFENTLGVDVAITKDAVNSSYYFKFDKAADDVDGVCFASGTHTGSPTIDQQFLTEFGTNLSQWQASVHSRSAGGSNTNAIFFIRIEVYN